MMTTRMALLGLVLVAACSHQAIPAPRDGALDGLAGESHPGASNQAAVGEPCTLTNLNPWVRQISSSAPDCATGLCLYVHDGAPLCTALCATDSSCPGPNASCASGFICRAPFLTGDVSCCRMCVCRDLLPSDGTDPCEGLTASCPQ